MGMWRPVVEALSWPVVQSGYGDGMIADAPKVGSPREILAKQLVGVLVRATLPGVLGDVVDKVD